jgi:porphobilinogen synthase
MLADVRLSVDELVAPLFVRSGTGVRREISSMPGQFQFSPDTALETVRCWADKGIPAVLLFGIPDRKDAAGSVAWDENAPVQQLARRIKETLPQVLVIADICLCEYTEHGHCGLLHTRSDGVTDVDNDATLSALARVSVSCARAGADILAPSAMMDGQVQAIRSALDEEGFADRAILSYAVKYASSLYGPFREAAEGMPKFGDRRTYQMDYAASRQAALEAQADLDEGADMFMVKPAATYLDVLADMRRRFDVPLAAYHVSGEYAMLKFAAAAKAIDEKAAVLETVSAIKRAGADVIVTYYAEQLADWI